MPPSRARARLRRGDRRAIVDRFRAAYERMERGRAPQRRGHGAGRARRDGRGRRGVRRRRADPRALPQPAARARCSRRASTRSTSTGCGGRTTTSTGRTSSRRRTCSRGRARSSSTGRSPSGRSRRCPGRTCRSSCRRSSPHPGISAVISALRVGPHVGFPDHLLGRSRCRTAWSASTTGGTGLYTFQRPDGSMASGARHPGGRGQGLRPAAVGGRRAGAVDRARRRVADAPTRD